MNEKSIIVGIDVGTTKVCTLVGQFRENGRPEIIGIGNHPSHGLKKGMGTAQMEEKAAVDCGYWHLWRYDPRLEAEGMNPFQLDSKEPDWSKFKDFLLGEVRYTQLLKSFPKQADELFEAARENAQWRYRSYQRMANTSFGDAAGSETAPVAADEEN